MASRIFLYIDNSNVFIEAKRLAPQYNGGDPGVKYRVRIDYDNLVNLCTCKRPLARAIVAGSVPPELQNLWQRLKNRGVTVRMYQRAPGMGEQEVPDLHLETAMYKDIVREKNHPGIAVLVTGDGGGFETDDGMGAALRAMHTNGWGVEVLSWKHCINHQMLDWVQQNGVFVALDDFYLSITFLEPIPAYGSGARHPVAIDYTQRECVPGNGWCL